MTLLISIKTISILSRATKLSSHCILSRSIYVFNRYFKRPTVILYMQLYINHLCRILSSPFFYYTLLKIKFKNIYANSMNFFACSSSTTISITIFPLVFSFFVTLYPFNFAIASIFILETSTLA